MSNVLLNFWNDHFSLNIILSNVFKLKSKSTHFTKFPILWMKEPWICRINRLSKKICSCFTIFPVCHMTHCNITIFFYLRLLNVNVFSFCEKTKTNCILKPKKIMQLFQLFDERLLKFHIVPITGGF